MQELLGDFVQYSLFRALSHLRSPSSTHRKALKDQGHTANAMECDDRGPFSVELLFHLFGFMNSKTLLSCSRVCTLWNEISNDKSLWKKLCLEDGFYEPPLDVLPSWLPSWKEAYRFMYESKFRVFPQGVVKEGRGCFCWLNGAKYEGEWLNDKEHGHGKKSWVDGATFDGEWVEGRFSGEGVHTWASGSRYQGQWLKHKRNGFGRNVWPQKDTYEGEWLDDQKSGFGTYVWSDGRMYRGEWKNDKRCGTGTFVWAPIGYKYEGEWLNDKGHGFGRFFWENGDCYEGQWQNGRRSGEGRFIRDGKFYLQKWNEEREFNALDKGDMTQEVPPTVVKRKEPEGSEVKEAEGRSGKRVKTGPYAVEEL